MAEILDQRQVSYEQSRRAAITLVTAKFLENLADVVYRFGAGATKCELTGPNGAWQLGLRTQRQTPRVMVRIKEPLLYDAVRSALRALGYEVRDKDDHLVVMI